jgi:hypothetical protein
MRGTINGSSVVCFVLRLLYFWKDHLQYPVDQRLSGTLEPVWMNVAVSFPGFKSQPNCLQPFVLLSKLYRLIIEKLKDKKFKIYINKETMKELPHEISNT